MDNIPDFRLQAGSDELMLKASPAAAGDPVIPAEGRSSGAESGHCLDPGCWRRHGWHQAGAQSAQLSCRGESQTESERNTGVNAVSTFTLTVPHPSTVTGCGCRRPGSVGGLQDGPPEEIHAVEGPQESRLIFFRSTISSTRQTCNWATAS